MLRGILTIGGWTMASRVLGFMRDVILADLLGAGPVADAFFVATRLPNLFRRLFGEGAFNAAFVPAFSGLLAAEGPEAAQIFAQEAFAVMAVWLCGLTAVFELCMPAVMTLFAAGFTADPAKFALVVQLARITFPYMPLICLTALLSGVLNGLDRFAAAAAAPVIYNVTSILFMLGLVGLVPTVGHAAAWGLSVSGIFQLALVMWAVRRAGMRLHLTWPRLTAQMRLLMRRMGPGLLGAGVVQLNLAIDSLIATLLPAGTVAVLNYADRLNQLPLAIIGTAVGTALLPTLSRQALSGQAEAAVGTLNRSLEYALAVTLPATLALIAIPVPIVAVLFGRGAMTAEDVRLTAGALAAFGTGLPAFVMVKQSRTQSAVHASAPASRAAARVLGRGLAERRRAGRHSDATRPSRARRTVDPRAAAHASGRCDHGRCAHLAQRCGVRAAGRYQAALAGPGGPGGWRHAGLWNCRPGHSRVRSARAGGPFTAEDETGRHRRLTSGMTCHARRRPAARNIGCPANKPRSQQFAYNIKKPPQPIPITFR
jgi:putative peptidoglycan lipid II flippase